MIVIAIIGILAAIAIPNFISYRNKTYCAATECDAYSIAQAITDYFAIPSHVGMPLISDLNGGHGVTLTAPNVLAAITGTDSNITITVWDGSKRCPEDYKLGMNDGGSNAYWGEQAFNLRMR